MSCGAQEPRMISLIALKVKSVLMTATTMKTLGYTVSRLKMESLLSWNQEQQNVFWNSVFTIYHRKYFTFYFTAFIYLTVLLKTYFNDWALKTCYELMIQYYTKSLHINDVTVIFLVDHYKIFLIKKLKLYVIACNLWPCSYTPLNTALCTVR